MLIVGTQQIPVVVNGVTQYFNNSHSVRLDDDGSGRNFVIMPFELSNRTFMVLAQGNLDIARVNRYAYFYFTNNAYLEVASVSRHWAVNRPLSPLTFPIVPQNKIALSVYGNSRNGWAKGRGWLNVTFYWN